MSFDRQTGDLWVGDVGWELWEMLYRVERGGQLRLGRDGRPAADPPRMAARADADPAADDRPPALRVLVHHRRPHLLRDAAPGTHGTHIYGDYDTGKFWGFRFENGKVVDHRELADTTHRVVGFGEDRDGEFYVLDHTAGTIHRLMPNPDAGSGEHVSRRS